MLSRFQAWTKTLPPPVQTLIYAVETGVAAALAVFLKSLYNASMSPQGISSFDWHAQIAALESGVVAAVVKALFDYFKGSPPTQTQKEGS